MKGPVAPKDPAKQRTKVYFMLEDTIVASNPDRNGFTEIIYLDGRVANKLTLICPTIAEEMAKGMQSSQEFYRMVHSIGVTVEAECAEDKDEEILVELQHYGKVDRYGTGCHMNMEVCCDGAERIFALEEFETGEVDDILGTLYFRARKQGLAAKATICFYLNDGFEAPAIEVDPPIDFDGEAYREMISHSLLAVGNTTRLRRAIEKAGRGEEVTIGFIGGSITQGAGAKPIHEKCYARLIFEEFVSLYAEKPETMHFVKAGIGGTSSELGLVRYDRDIAGSRPDLVIVEFAVNDEGDETKGICYESLISKIWNGPGSPAIILLFSVFQNDWNLQDRLAPIGMHYQLPMVSVKDAVSPQFPEAEGRVITKRQYFYDCYHPTNEGHRIMADCVMYMIEQSLIDVEEPPVWPEQACLGRPYENVVTFTRDNTAEEMISAGVTLDCGSFSAVDTALQRAERDKNPTATAIYENNWMRPDDAKDLAPFLITCRCRSLFVIFKDCGDLSGGKANVYVNGKLVKALDPHIVGWNHCNSTLIIPDGEEKDYVVKIAPADEDCGKYFTILGFAIGR